MVIVGGHTWLRYMSGLFNVGPRFQAEPLLNKDVFVVGNGGPAIGGGSITLGEGEPGEITLDVQAPSTFAAWLDGSDGLLQQARLLSTSTGSMQSNAQHWGLDVADDGDILLTGFWSGQNDFHRDTPYQTVMSTPYTLNGNVLDHADDPYFTRMDETGAVQWLRRGFTPSPLTATWANWPYGGIVALPGGDSLVAGMWTYSGFVLGYDTLGAVTMLFDDGVYIARLDDQGVPLWVGPCTGDLVFHSLEASPGGEVYAMADEGTTLFTGTPEEVSIPPEIDDDDNSWMRALVRLDPDGGVLWVRRLVTIGTLINPALAVRDDGSVVISAVAEAEFQLRDEQGTAASVITESPERVLTSLSADGEVQWMISTGVDTWSFGHWTLETVGDDVWVDFILPGDASEIAIGDQVLPLPDLQFDPAVNLSLLARFDASGAVAEVRVLGTGLRLLDLSSDGASLLVTGDYHCNPVAPSVFDDMGVAVALPPCDQINDNTTRGYVMSLPL